MLALGVEPFMGCLETEFNAHASEAQSLSPTFHDIDRVWTYTNQPQGPSFQYRKTVSRKALAGC